MEAISKILVVEDEITIGEAIVAYLEREGYSTQRETDGTKALETFLSWSPDLVILDRMLPGMWGDDICMEIRKQSRVPIIIITAKSDEEDKLEGFKIGGDDYLTKPFSLNELMARVGSLLRRSQEGNGALYQKMSWNQEDLVVDFGLHQVKKKGKEVNLTPNEYKILSILMKYPNKIFTREELLNTAFGWEYDGYERTIDSHIKNLRSKIEDDSSKPVYIITIRGVGYGFGG